jgi:hypothetical protein
VPLPSKVASLEESCLGIALSILSRSPASEGFRECYRRVGEPDPFDFEEALKVLFLVGKIEYDAIRGVLVYAAKN